MSLNLPVDCYFLILPGFLPLDLAGPLQVLVTANDDKSRYRLHYIGPAQSPVMAGGLGVTQIAPLPERLPPNSRLIIPGINQTASFLQSAVAKDLFTWLAIQRSVDNLTLVTVCSGALIAAKAGWLKHKHCTTHHDLIDQLHIIEPTAKIAENSLYITDQNVWTSAGISSGIDLMLALLENDCGSAFTARVAREMVVYFRRSGDDPQLSPWFSGRNHLHRKIHQVQDLIARAPAANDLVEQLAEKVNMSPRNLTRQFRRCTDESIQVYREKLRIGLAEKLLKETNQPIESISEACGFQSARSFRRAWSRYHKDAPISYRCLARSRA